MAGSGLAAAGLRRAADDAWGRLERRLAIPCIYRPDAERFYTFRRISGFPGPIGLLLPGVPADALLSRGQPGLLSALPHLRSEELLYLVTST